MRIKESWWKPYERMKELSNRELQFENWPLSARSKKFWHVTCGADSISQVRDSEKIADRDLPFVRNLPLQF
jgi:hypothetical protein